MSRTYFITGTDTEVGKTAISCAILEAAAQAGLRTAAIKPVAAGCDAQGHNEDALQLLQSMSENLSYEQVNPVALAEAIAPHIAAEREGRRMQASRLAGLCRGVMMSGADFTLIEGAGGWRVPISPAETLADVAVALKVEVVMVVGMRLGCVNHALLTAEAIRRDGLKLAGWVANQPGERMSCHAENVLTLSQLLPAPLLGDMPHLASWNPSEATQYIDIKELLL